VEGEKAIADVEGWGGWNLGCKKALLAEIGRLYEDARQVGEGVNRLGIPAGPVGKVAKVQFSPGAIDIEYLDFPHFPLG